MEDGDPLAPDCVQGAEAGWLGSMVRLSSLLILRERGDPPCPPSALSLGPASCSQGGCSGGAGRGSLLGPRAGKIEAFELPVNCYFIKTFSCWAQPPVKSLRAGTCFS
jgi:hypothetical protein